jgi:hypothetical protein
MVGPIFRKACKTLDCGTGGRLPRWETSRSPIPPSPPCSAGHPGRSLEWLRPLHFGAGCGPDSTQTHKKPRKSIHHVHGNGYVLRIAHAAPTAIARPYSGGGALCRAQFEKLKKRNFKDLPLILLRNSNAQVGRKSPQQPFQEQNERNNQGHKRKPQEQRMNGTGTRAHHFNSAAKHAPTITAARSGQRRRASRAAQTARKARESFAN